eukprot:TRINITY_DN2933_c0_g1_i1.p1 TRINITY_DN2933_c0_g1~~TRINITY_DN2933_c0_g1_i1.p1  ORF type:complete len:591 (+),score=26.20 TRINITY_DN2933_c0_g1_i1:50-1774(+)
MESQRVMMFNIQAAKQYFGCEYNQFQQSHSMATSSSQLAHNRRKVLVKTPDTILFSEILKRRTKPEPIRIPLKDHRLYPESLNDNSPSTASRSPTNPKRNSTPSLIISTATGKIVKATLTRPLACKKLDPTLGKDLRKPELNSVQETAVETERNECPTKRLMAPPRSRKKLSQQILRRKFLAISDAYNAKVVNDIVFDEDTHMVAVFKDYLIYDDTGEFLKRVYDPKESKQRLIKIFDYYENYTKVFPNYFVLQGNQFMFKNIERKQRAIDKQQQKGPVQKEKYSKVFTTGFLKEFEKKSIESDSMLGSVSQYQSYIKHLPSFGNISSITRRNTNTHSIVPEPKAAGLDEILNCLIKEDPVELRVNKPREVSPIRIVKIKNRVTPVKKLPRILPNETPKLFPLTILPLSAHANTRHVTPSNPTRNSLNPIFGARSQSTHQAHSTKTQRKVIDIRSTTKVLRKDYKRKLECMTPSPYDLKLVFPSRAQPSTRHMPTPTNFTRNFQSPQGNMTAKREMSMTPVIDKFSVEGVGSKGVLRRKKMDRAKSDANIGQLMQLYGNNRNTKVLAKKFVKVK